MMDRAWHQRILGWIGDTVKDAYTGTPQLVAPYTPAYHRPPTATSIHPPAPPSPGPPASQLGVRAAEAPARADPGPKMSMLFKANAASNRDIPREISTVSVPGVADDHGAISEKGLLSTALSPEPRIRSIKMVELLALHIDSYVSKPDNMTKYEHDLRTCHLSQEQLQSLKMELLSAWDDDHPRSILPTLQRWNQSFFYENGGQIALCEEYGSQLSNYAIFHFSTSDPLPRDDDRYDSVPERLHRLDIWSSTNPTNPDAEIKKISLLFGNTEIFDGLREARQDDLVDAGPSSLFGNTAFEPILTKLDYRINQCSLQQSQKPSTLQHDTQEVG
ncbi:hypothetical protein BDZ97DRAFT_1815540 [Flammula alnicola]|nr:hypothetical protein BDZ97DRAFT_1815540 [Flammula alnicola]